MRTMVITRDRRFGRPAFMVGLLLLAGCAASGRATTPSAGEEYHHDYAVSQGDELRFENSATTLVEMTGLMQESYSLEISSTFTLRVERKGRGGIDGIVEIEKASMDGDAPGIMAPAGISAERLEGELFDVEIGPGGKVRELLGRSVGTETGGIINLESTLSGIFIPWPPGPVRPGQTWTDSTESEHSQSGMRMSTKLLATYTYLGLETVEDDEIEGPLHAVRRVTTTTSTGGGVIEGGEMVVRSTGNGEATFYFDVHDGILVLARYTEELSSISELSGAMNMSMPVEMRSETVTRRIRQ